jgi:hypothetical protein
MTTTAQKIAFRNARHTKACHIVADRHGLTGLKRDLFVFACDTMPTFATVARQFSAKGEVFIALAELVESGLVRVQTMGQTIRYIPIRIDA